jgi:hypothetical protein
VEPERVLSEEEIESRAAEGGGSGQQEEPLPPPRRRAPSEERRAAVRDEEEPPPPEGELRVDFNPFETSGPSEVLEEDPVPVRTVPIPKPPVRDQRQLSPIERELLARGSRPAQPATVVASDPSPQRQGPPKPGPTNTPDTAFAALPSVDVGVLEEPGRREKVPPPQIDRSTVGQSKNPRFQRPGSGGG